MSATPLVPVSNDWCKCYACGVWFASSVISLRRQDGKSFYCPNGHSQHYTETAEARLRAELEGVKRDRDYYQKQYRTKSEEAKWARADAKRKGTVLRKTKERIKNGVCPCCNRSFENLRRHMETKHPQFKASEGA
jgi:hypothetical protein